MHPPGGAGWGGSRVLIHRLHAPDAPRQTCDEQSSSRCRMGCRRNWTAREADEGIRCAPAKEMRKTPAPPLPRPMVADCRSEGGATPSQVPPNTLAPTEEIHSLLGWPGVGG